MKGTEDSNYEATLHQSQLDLHLGKMSLGRGASLGTPDQGWAWVVLVAVVLSQGMTLGFPSCIGVFYTDIQTSFQATNSETSWFPSIVTAVLHAGGPLCSILVECYGCRVTVLLGGLLASVGMVSSSFSQTILQLYLTAGFIAGLLVDYTGHYHYIFYATSVIMSSAALFMGLSTYALNRKEAKIREMAKLVPRDPLLEGPNKPEGICQNHPEVTYITSI